MVQRRHRAGARSGRPAELGARDVQSVLLEGGPHLAGAFLDAGEIDEARVFIAPLLAGGSRARGALDGQGVELIGEAPQGAGHRRSSRSTTTC